MAKWWRKSIIQWIVWLDSTVAWVISHVSVYLIFDHHANDGHPDEYREAHLCYLWCLLVYLPFYRSTSTFFLMVKWCNDEMISDGASMMVILFFCGNSICALECTGWKLSLERILSSRDKIPGDMSRGTVPVAFVPRTTIEKNGHTIGTLIVLGKLLV